MRTQDGDGRRGSSITRRMFLKAGALTGAAILMPWEFVYPRAARTAYAQTTAVIPPHQRFVTQLPIPAVAPKATTQPYAGADYYEITMQADTWPLFSPALGPATVWGYRASGVGVGGAIPYNYLGPTIEARQGRPVVVRFTNKLPATNEAFPVAGAIDPTIMGADLAPGRATPHLHGGFTPPQFDGHPDSWFAPAGSVGAHYASLPGAAPNEAIYWYSNQQPATMLWYHDHARGITRLNAYVGLAALYFIRDANDTGQTSNPLYLPAKKYEIPLVLQDKQFNADGSLFYPTDNGFAEDNPNHPHPIWVPEFFGDTPVVNAVAYPNLRVEPRRYRFRIVNGSQARFYNLALSPVGGTPMTFYVIGSEQSLLPAPAATKQLLIAPGERYDVIVDFATMPFGSDVLVTNDANAPYPDGTDEPPIPTLMRIQVNQPLSGNDATANPAKGKLKLPPLAGALLPTITPATPRRQIVMKERMDDYHQPVEVKLNERYFDEPAEETPKVGTIEVWEFLNCTGDAHPMHLHLVRFQVWQRQAFDADAFWADYDAWVQAGRQGPSPDVNGYLTGPVVPVRPEESGWKDTAISLPGEVLRIVAKFDVPAANPKLAGTATQLPAEYVYHCHILEHEENDMMRPFQVIP